MMALALYSPMMIRTMGGSLYSPNAVRSKANLPRDNFTLLQQPTADLVHQRGA
ncbi:hypothetical protein B0H13DRAFT_2318833 [Mycena leptocephala]|nr:hypothetical protein B0H13DRAFT_2318833 [Mycena leptocephala]